LQVEDGVQVIGSIARVVTIGAGLALFVACGGSSPPAAPPPSTQSTLLGKPAPAFKRDAVDGSHVEVAANPGKVVVVKFVAKYCEPCIRTLPAIEKLHAKHPEIAIVGVSEDERESEARELVSTYNLTFSVVHDNQQVLAARYRVRDLPVTYVLDGHGTVAWVGGPEKTESDLVTAIEATKP
jgi:cytochrome c biogenesis protein CcmG, thiol:disulfide interchange protein DsbE